MVKVKTLLSDFVGLESKPCLGEIQERRAVVAIFDNGSSLGSDIEAWIKETWLKNPTTVQTFVAEINNLSNKSRKVVRVRIFSVLGFPLIPPSFYIGVIEAFGHFEQAIREHWMSIPIQMRRDAVSMVSAFVGEGTEESVDVSHFRFRFSLLLISLSLSWASFLSRRDIRRELKLRLSSLIDAVLQASVDDPEFQKIDPCEIIQISSPDGEPRKTRCGNLSSYLDDSASAVSSPMPPRRR